MSDLKPIVLLGGGGHAKVVLAALRALGHEPLGFIDQNRTALEEELSYLGDDTAFQAKNFDGVLANGIGIIKGGPGSARQRMFEYYSRDLGYRFHPIVHPYSWVAPHTELGEGCQVMAGAVIQPASAIGANCIINTRAVIEHDCKQGTSVHVAPGAVVCGGVRIGNNVHVGAGAVILQGLQVGDNVTIGAGAVVLQDLPSGATAYGVPARENTNHRRLP